MIGFLNVYKPSGVTSHDVVQKVRKTLSIKQIGHGGTLDPLAEGVLPIAVGSACRLLRFLGHEKIYLAEILFGQKTDTDDIEGKTIARFDEVAPPAQEEIVSALASFHGTIMQRPPLYSAIHQDGKRLYELAREGKTPEIAEREVEIRSITILNYDYPVLQVRIECGGGTYIRSIARDLGDMLKCGGTLKSLVRERSGPFTIGGSVQLETHKDRESLGSQVETPTRALTENADFAVLEIDEGQKRALKMGQKLSLSTDQAATFINAIAVLAIFEKEIIAVCKLEEGTIKPEVVLSNG